MSKIIAYLGLLFAKQDEYYEVKVAILAIIALVLLVWLFYVLSWARKTIHTEGILGVWNHVKDLLQTGLILVCVFGGIALLVIFIQWLFS